MRRNQWTRRAALLAVPAAAAAATRGEALGGTGRLEENGDFGEAVVANIDRYLDGELHAAINRRAAAWSSAVHDEESVRTRRERLRVLLGMVDPVLPGMPRRTPIGGCDRFTIDGITWPVWAGVHGEGLLLEPDAEPLASVIAIPDADVSPEELCGAGTQPAAMQYARTIAEAGCRVLVPVLVDRGCEWSRSKVRATNQPHREFIWRMAFELGRHIIGYEACKLIAALGWLKELAPGKPVLLAGYGEGGLLALHAGAVESGFDGVLAGGYFQARDEAWREPVYRHIHGSQREFGDAEIAALIAPRPLVIADQAYPAVDGPPGETKDRKGAAPGRIGTPGETVVRSEFLKAREVWDRSKDGGRCILVSRQQAASDPLAAVNRLLRAAGIPNRHRAGGPILIQHAVDAKVRLKRQFDELVSHTLRLGSDSERVRASFWKRSDASSVDRWRETTGPYRQYFHDRVLGRLPDPTERMEAASRMVMDEPGWTGYQVRLTVWRGCPAYGMLLVPKDLSRGERRPVVVCQHGGRGRSRDVIAADNARAERLYHSFGSRLADQGFVVYAPQSPFIGPQFLPLMSKARPLGLTMYSFTIGMHQRVLEWLGGLSFVDAERIGFYGFSYGGKEAMRIPALLGGYALSICSGDFSDWLKRAMELNDPSAYTTGSKSWDIPAFDMSNTFGYPDLAGLIAPRPFMVERGLSDGGRNQWVAAEFERVRRLYIKLGIPDRVAIEYFDGEHEVRAGETVRFLRKHLRWPEKRS